MSINNSPAAVSNFITPSKAGEPNRPVDGSIASAASGLDSKLQSFGNTTAVKAAGSASSGFNAFPSQLFTTDARDQHFAIRKDVINANGVVPGVGLATAGDEYFKYLEDKSKQLQYADFKNWLLSDVIKADTPEAQAYWKSKFPELFEEKVSLLKDQLNLAGQLQRIAVLGADNLEDYMLIYALKRGIIQLPRGAPWQPGFIPTISRNDVNRALFNPKRFFPAGSSTLNNSPAFAWTNPLAGPAAGNSGGLGWITGQNTSGNFSSVNSNPSLF